MRQAPQRSSEEPALEERGPTTCFVTSAPHSSQCSPPPRAALAVGTRAASVSPEARMAPVPEPAGRPALEKFLESQTSGVEVGLGYFGNDALGQTSCDPNHYATPAVPIAPLPQNTAPLEQSLNQAAPTGETPTGAAIRGACTVARN